MSEYEVRALKRTVLQMWSDFVNRQREQRVFRLRAGVFHRWTLSKKVLNRWREINAKGKLLRENELRVLVGHSAYLKHMGLRAFIYTVIMNRNERKKCLLADYCYRRTCLSRIVGKWKTFKGVLENEARIKDDSLVFHNEQLRKRAFLWLCSGVRMKRQNQNMKYQSYVFLWNSCGKRVFSQLKWSQLSRRQLKIERIRGSQMLRRNRKKTVFSRLGRLVGNRDYWVQKRAEMNKVYQWNSLRTVFGKFAFPEGLEIYNRKLVRSCFGGICGHREYSKVKRENAAVADEQYCLKVMKTHFKAIKVYRVLCLRKANRKYKAEIFNRAKLLSLYINKWDKRLKDIEKHEYFKETAGEYRVKYQYKQVMRKWIDFTKREQLKTHARTSRGARLISVAYFSLKYYKARKEISRTHAETADAFYAKSLKGKGITAFACVKSQTEYYHQKLSEMIEFHRNKLNEKGILAFKQYMAANTENIAKRKSIQRNHSIYMNSTHFRYWQTFLKQSKTLRQQQIEATSLVQQMKTSTHFALWKDKYLEKIQKKKLKTIRLETAQSTLNQFVLFRVFTNWTDYFKSRVIYHLMKKKADRIHKNYLSIKFFHAIKYYAYLEQLKQKHTLSAQQHHCKSLKHSLFHQLKAFHQQVKNREFNTILALKFWSQTKLRNSIVGLFYYKEKNKEQLLREEKALELRKHDLIEDLMVKWLRVGLFWKNQSELEAVSNKILNEERVWRTVRNCANKFLDALNRRTRHIFTETRPPEPKRELSQVPEWVQDIGVPRQRQIPRVLDNSNSIMF